MIPSVFEACEPREDVRAGRLDDAQLAADLAQVLAGRAPPLYADPAVFFANTYPTQGLKGLLRNVLAALAGSGEQVGSVFRLHTNFGGGKTHGLIALVHAARGLRGVADPEAFVDPALLPRAPVRIAAFDGENADPANGRRLQGDLLAYTPWGELAFQLADRQGLARVEASDRQRIAPGADTLRELLADRPTLILLDELAVWLRKSKALPGGERHAREQLTAFLSALVKAVESTPRCALVFTLAVGAEGDARDAYAAEHEAVRAALDELAAVAARKATILNPTRDDETVRVLARRLFAHLDPAARERTVAAYAETWRRFADQLPPAVRTAEARDGFLESWPFHPDLVALLREKLASLGKFQRIRGMLRLLGRVVHRLWQERPADTFAIHTHHVDLGFQPLRDELTTRLERPDMVPPLLADVDDGGGGGLARELDRRHFAGLPPFASRVARTIFLHSLAFPEERAGVGAPELRFALLGPEDAFDLIEQARQLFAAASSFLDDRPGAPYRFRTEPNLTRIVHQEEQRVDPGALRDRLRARIREVFDGRTLELVPFAAGPWDVPDSAEGKRPRLVLVSHEAARVERVGVVLPELVARIFRERGQGGEFRRLRNHLLFVVAEAQEIERMEALARRRLALEKLAEPDWSRKLPEYQRNQVKESRDKADAELSIAIQKAYRHVFYPSPTRLEGSTEDLAHTVLEHASAAAKPGDGQRMIVELLRSLGKLRLPEDEPDAPAFVRDRTPLRKGSITTGGLRQEFFQDPSLAMLVGDDVFLKLVRKAVDQGDWVYRCGDFIWAKGLPPPARIETDEQSELFTAPFARERGIWPRPEPPPPPPPPPPPVGPGPRPPGGGDGIPPPPPPPEPPPAPAADELEEEDVLQAALSRLFERARARGWKAVAELELRPFEPRDAFTLAGLASLVPKARKRIAYEAELATAGGGQVTLRFEGGPEDEKPVRDFLRPQFETAHDKGLEHDLQCRLQLAFEGGLPLAGPEPAQLVERLAKAGAAAAQVRARAKARP